MIVHSLNSTALKSQWFPNSGPYISSVNISRNLLEMHVFQALPRPIESETLGLVFIAEACVKEVLQVILVKANH